MKFVNSSIVNFISLVNSINKSFFSHFFFQAFIYLFLKIKFINQAGNVADRCLVLIMATIIIRIKLRHDYASYFYCVFYLSSIVSGNYLFSDIVISFSCCFLLISFECIYEQNQETFYYCSIDLKLSEVMLLLMLPEMYWLKLHTINMMFKGNCIPTFY